MGLYRERRGAVLRGGALRLCPEHAEQRERALAEVDDDPVAGLAAREHEGAARRLAAYCVDCDAEKRGRVLAAVVIACEAEGDAFDLCPDMADFARRSTREEFIAFRRGIEDGLRVGRSR